MIGATVLEYVTGWAMEAIFKMKYWDYSKNKWNLHGRICLKSSLFWGVLAVALVEWIHPPVERLVLRMDHTLPDCAGFGDFLPDGGRHSGCGAYGIGFKQVAGKIDADKIRGRPSPDGNCPAAGTGYGGAASKIGEAAQRIEFAYGTGWFLEKPVGESASQRTFQKLR